MSDLEAIIEESVEDASAPETDTPEVAETPEVHGPEEVSDDGTDVETSPAIAAQAEVHKPAEKDEFETKWGVPQQTVSGRENRIPYSRVKKITSNAERELAELALGRKFTPEELAKKEFKVHDFVKSHVAQIPHLTAKVADYEDRFKRVQKFEHIMVNDQEKFLTMLQTLPGYQPFFNAIERAYEIIERSGGLQNPQVQQQSGVNGPPEPDETLPDGSKVYTLDGLSKRDAWNREQAKREVLEEVEKKFGPIHEEREAFIRYNQTANAVNKQIEEARKWENFTDNEDEITKVLQKNPTWSLERAYNHVVLPKFKADRQSMREAILKELKTAPKSTSAPAASTKSATNEGSGDLTAVIVDAMRAKGLKG